VLAVGKIDHVDFYREVTRGLGVAEYITKPLNRDQIARHFGPFLRGQTPVSDTVQGGRAISITGVRGGVGATTMAVNLAWNFGVSLRRHTVLLDPDVHLGAAAFLLNLQPGPGLRMALEAPDRIDALLAERAAQPAADRLHVLAGEEKMTTPANHAPGAAASLLSALRRRYNFSIADVPFAPVPLYRDLLDLVDHRILIMEPTLAAIRDTVRLLGLPKGPAQNQRATIVLNRVGLPGGLTRRQVEDALKLKVDVVIPDLPRQIGTAATLGEPALTSSSAFRNKVMEVANQVASMRMVDAQPSSSDQTPEAGISRWRWFKRGQ
jgi:pilus assembly protein CpaE